MALLGLGTTGLCPTPRVDLSAVLAPSTETENGVPSAAACGDHRTTPYVGYSQGHNKPIGLWLRHVCDFVLFVWQE